MKHNVMLYVNTYKHKTFTSAYVVQREGTVFTGVCPQGCLPWSGGGVPTLAEGVSTLAGGGVPALAGGIFPWQGVTYLPWPGGG